MTHNNILVVEDYADLRSALLSVLVRAHYTCDGVGNSEDALDKLRQHEYAAILLAPMLPIMDDPVVRYVAANPSCSPKIILMTDSDQSNDTFGSLTKPFNPEQLFAQLLPQ
ncbi:MAG: hypothetical protein NVSMB68_10890 [Thermoanaerobaculia bacterium]